MEFSIVEIQNTPKNYVTRFAAPLHESRKGYESRTLEKRSNDKASMSMPK